MKRSLFVLPALVLSLALLAPGCGKETKLTQVVLLLDTTDYAIPAEIDWVDIYVHSATQVNSTPVAFDHLTDNATATLGFVLEGEGRLTDYVLEAEFFVGTSSTPVVVQRAVFDFEAATTLRLEMKLHSACAGVSCCGVGAAGACTQIETCDAAGSCVGADYDFDASSSPLTTWEGAAPDGGL